VLFADSRYVEAAQKKACCSARLLTKVNVEIKEYIKEKNILKIHTERNKISVATADFLKTVFLPCRVTPSKKLEKKISEIRVVKTPDEVENIKIAQKIAEDAFEHILSFIKPGVAEKQIALELDVDMLSHGV
jgi:Xaa-Pro aminopeptidase